MKLTFFTGDPILERFFVQIGMEGVYRVDFAEKTVEFIPGELELENVPMVMLGINIPIEDYLVPLDSPYNSSGNAMHYEWGQVNVGGDRCILDYLDTREGEISLHPHKGNVKEVYLSAEAPYSGEICDVGEYHKPFTEKTIAVKIIYGER